MHQELLVSPSNSTVTRYYDWYHRAFLSTFWSRLALPATPLLRQLQQTSIVFRTLRDLCEGCNGRLSWLPGCQIKTFHLLSVQLLLASLQMLTVFFAASAKLMRNFPKALLLRVMCVSTFARLLLLILSRFASCVILLLPLCFYLPRPLHLPQCLAADATLPIAW